MFKKINLKISESSPKFTLILWENLEYWKRISFWKSWNALQKLIWSIFLWSFFDYCSRTAAFSKIFSVVDVPARLLCWAPKSVMMQKWNNFAIFSKLFQVLWLYQQSIKNFAIYEEKINCGMRKKATPTLNWLYSLQQVRCVLLIRMTCFWKSQ